ncbi:MAG: indole-3-glycerol phosphate synthase TrpC [Legionellales bacterium]
MTSILQQIAEQKAQEVARAKKSHPLNTLPQQPPQDLRDFIAALKPNSTPAIIAEIKKASPSKGIIKEDFNVAQIAQSYADNGARCLSVLTDPVFFQGRPEYVATAKAQCKLPVLRKDFIIDPYQIYESLAIGADCILLIVALLDDKQLVDYCTLAQELGMAVLVESHTKEELIRALEVPTPLIGINNRSLHTFETDIQLSITLKEWIPEDRIVVSESGIHSRDEVQLMRSHGINTFLIGESLMRAKDVGKALYDLIKDP